MTILDQILGAVWTLFIIYWLVSAISSKKNLRHERKGALIRIVTLIAIVLIFQTHAFQELALRYNFANHELAGIIGLILCVLGLGFAVWARVHLGRNWGMPMSLKKDAELVTTGPYRLVRHPIYAGILLATLGSSLVEGLWWFVFFVFFVVYFAAFSAREEEKMMTERFPNEYPAYKKRTKMLIPFIL